VSFRDQAYERTGLAVLTNGRLRRRMPSWPELDGAALHGLAGEIVAAVEPHSEADPVAVLVSLLSAYGNVVGRSAHFRVGAGKHHLKINAALVGETSKGRKGMSWDYVADLMGAVAPEWTEGRVVNGLSSGEGLIYAVRDRVVGEDKDGEPVVRDPGELDKRLFVMEGEFAGVLSQASREGNVLSAVIRSAWDTGKLNTLTKNNPTKATDAHISIVGHITRTELVRLLTESDAHNGFANRFLWLCVRRSKRLPFGGEWHTEDVAPLVRELREAIAFGQSAGEIHWGDSARGPWTAVYDDLSEGHPGLLGATTSRAEAQTVRLACIYALLDGSRYIEASHLEAALAVWRYCEDSARLIFGEATGDGVADRIEEALLDEPSGMSRNEIRDMFGRNKSSERIGEALEMLRRLGRVEKLTEETGGRPREKWILK
jgi:hypothetical protein